MDKCRRTNTLNGRPLGTAIRTLDQVGQILDPPITGGYVGMIEKKILVKLRKALEDLRDE